MLTKRVIFEDGASHVEVDSSAGPAIVDGVLVVAGVVPVGGEDVVTVDLSSDGAGRGPDGRTHTPVADGCSFQGHFGRGEVDDVGPGYEGTVIDGQHGNDLAGPLKTGNELVMVVGSRPRPMQTDTLRSPLCSARGRRFSPFEESRGRSLIACVIHRNNRHRLS